jgi:hypothetical protein
LAIAAGGAGHAQTSGAGAGANDQKARAILDQMVAALGGQRWLTLQNSTLVGRTSGFYQGKPTGDISDYTQITQYPGQTRIEIGKKRNVVEIFTGNEGWEVTYRGKGRIPADQVADFVRRRDHSIEIAVRVWLKDPKTILIYGGQQMVERHLADQVILINAENDSIEIETDVQSHLPLRRSWQWRDPVYKDKNTDAEEYDDYHVIDGIPTPFDVTRYHNGDMTNQRFLYRAAYDTALPPETFDPDATAAKIKK